MKFPEPAIYELLKNLAGGQVFHLQAKRGMKAPFIVYQRVDSSRWRSINGPSGWAQAVLQIDCYAKTITECKNLSGQVETILDGYNNTVYYGSNSPQDSILIGGISLQNDTDLVDQTEEPILYRNLSNYLVTYEQ